ncbi:glycosyltransferase family 4 protein [Winogradskyella sp.]|uniref:glycosyltransferase family 4 protein n=2 Tax=Winogradskyella sp. TaxID=1883156 RepID=UPI003511A0EA
MHICFITSEYPKKGYPHGGIGTFISTLSRGLVKRGHRVTVVGINSYTNTDEYQVDDDVCIYRLKPKKLKGLTWYLNNRAINAKLRAIHEQNSIDIVETAELGLAFVNKIKSINYVIRLHGGHHFFAEAEKRKVSWWKGLQEKRSFKKADGFIAVSKFVKSHTAKYLSYHNKPIKVIMSPINLDIFKPIPEIEIQPNTILFAGTVCEKKGAHQLIKAMPKVLEVFPDVQLHMYGRDWFFKDGSSYIAYLKNHISKLAIKKSHIQFMGSVSMHELAKKYGSAEICVFPSLMETQGLVAPEAMATEKLVIFSKCGPGPETVEHNKTGLLCDPYDDQDIANKIIWALKHKPEAIKIAKNARNHVISNFNMDALIKKNIEFYNFVISQ